MIIPIIFQFQKSCLHKCAKYFILSAIKSLPCIIPLTNLDIVFAMCMTVGSPLSPSSPAHATSSNLRQNSIVFQVIPTILCLNEVMLSWSSPGLCQDCKTQYSSYQEDLHVLSDCPM